MESKEQEQIEKRQEFILGKVEELENSIRKELTFLTLSERSFFTDCLTMSMANIVAYTALNADSIDANGFLHTYKKMMRTSVAEGIEAARSQIKKEVEKG